MTVCLASSNKMDVTSLLNSSSAAAAAAALQRRDSVSSSTPSATGDTTAASTAVHTPSPDRTPPRRTSGSRSPSRNRTPWDAGGYSLPLTLDTKAIPSSPSNSRPNFYHNSDSPTDCGANASASPKSPKHKFSDSRSSLSSYSSSSNNSLSHSRISSLSTVSEYQPLTALITDISLDGKPAASNGMAEKIEGGPDRLSSFDSTPVGATQDDNRSSVGGSLHNDSLDRPESPSDAVMIRRGLDGLTGGLGSPANAHKRAVSAPDMASSNFAHSAPPPSTLPAVTPQTHPTSHATAQHSHQVTASVVSQAHVQPALPQAAPSQLLPIQQSAQLLAAPATLASSVPQSAAAPLAQLPPLPNATWTSPLLSLSVMGNLAPTYTDRQGVVRSYEVDTRNRARELEGTRPSVETMINTKEEACTYQVPCNLGSTLRKAISHLFGRNKLCTRQIPSYVWVHYCRKHYQRARYRNADDFYATQAQLVEETIFRVQAWSDMNQRQMEANERDGKDAEPLPVLRDWSLSVRKREKKRVDDKKEKKACLNENNKRRRGDDSDNSDAEDDDENYDTGLAVNGWLRDMCERDYTSYQMLQIAHRIWIELRNGLRPKMPDIEILPNILINEKDQGGKGTKVSTRRKASVSGHKRSQSMGVGMHSQNTEAYPMARRVSQPNVGNGYQWSSDEYSAHAEKRQRVGEPSNLYQARDESLPNLPRRMAERTVPTMRQLPQFQSRAAFGNIRENRTEDRFYETRPPVSTSSGMYQFGSMATTTAAGPLPAPAPRPVAGPSFGQQNGGVEQYGSRYESRNRASHQRSFSDAGAFQYTSQVYRPPGTAEYTPATFQPTGYPGAHDTYSSPNASSYGAASGYSSYYGDYGRTQAPQTTSYMGSGYGYQGNNGSAANGSAMGVYGGGIKHMRHQSTPVAPRLLRGGHLSSTATTTSSQLPNIPPTYSAEHGALNGYGQQSARSQHSYSSSQLNMPRVEEMEGGASSKGEHYAQKNDFYDSRR